MDQFHVCKESKCLLITPMAPLQFDNGNQRQKIDTSALRKVYNNFIQHTWGKWKVGQNGVNLNGTELSNKTKIISCTFQMVCQKLFMMSVCDIENNIIPIFMRCYLDSIFCFRATHKNIIFYVIVFNVFRFNIFRFNIFYNL